MIEIKLTLSLEEMQKTLERMGFIIYKPSDKYLKDYYKWDKEDTPRSELMSESDKIFVADGKAGPVLGPLGPVFLRYYKQTMLRLMEQY